MKKLLLGLLTLSSFSSFAGNGSSGGGHIYGDQLNPWFLQNTKSVKYCVEIDPQFSQLNKSQVTEVIERSIAYWKRTFAGHQENFKQVFSFEAKLGTQEFLETECDENTDLRFQLGFLTEEQKKQLPNYRQLIGLAYRTNYDEEALKGKGFIYIAPEVGDLRPVSANMHPKPWSHGKHKGLETVLIHELGHVFGLQDDHYSYFGIMNAKVVEYMTEREAIDSLNTSDGYQIPSPFGCNSSFDGDHKITYTSVEIPGWSSTAPVVDIRAELGLPKSFDVRFITANNSMKILVDQKEFGRVQLQSFGEVTGGVLDPAVSLYLTSKQKVFNGVPEYAYNTHLTIYNVYRDILRKNEELTLMDGKRYKVFIRYDQQCAPSIGMIHQDELISDIFNGQ